MVEPKIGIDDFILLKLIGKGSYGKVMLVRKIDSGELLAIKMLKKDFIERRNQVLHTKTERNVLARVNHPFIVKLKYAFQNTKKLYFALEFCAGGELFYHLQKERTFTEARTRFYASCIVLALEHLHEKDIIYRDLKPENILLDAEGYVKITDFGLSKEEIQGNTGAFSFCGTPEYLAPEILLKKGHGKAVDWWSLGALIYEMLTGLPPFYTTDRERLFNSILNTELNIPGHLSAAVKDLLSKLFVKDPNSRLGSGGTSEIKSHPWFRDIHWEELLQKQVPPPFVPILNSNNITGNFDIGFTKEPAVDSAGREPKLAGSPTFNDWSYKNPNYLEDMVIDSNPN